jgi:hypothetical protein
MQNGMPTILSVKSIDPYEIETNKNETVLLLDQLETNNNREMNKIKKEVGLSLVEYKIINSTKDTVINSNNIINKPL